MLGPTVNPRLDGSVQGVVVQAMKKASPPTSIASKIFATIGFLELIFSEGLGKRNIATTLVSFTSL